MDEHIKCFEEYRGLQALGKFTDDYVVVRFSMNGNDSAMLVLHLCRNAGTILANLNRWLTWMWNAPEGAVTFKKQYTRLVEFGKACVKSTSEELGFFVENRTHSQNEVSCDIQRGSEGVEPTLEGAKQHQSRSTILSSVLRVRHLNRVLSMFYGAERKCKLQSVIMTIWTNFIRRERMGSRC